MESGKEWWMNWCGEGGIEGGKNAREGLIERGREEGEGLTDHQLMD